MENPIHRPTSSKFAISEPRNHRQGQSDHNVLRQNSPNKGGEHHKEFVQRPKPDELGIIQMLR